MKRHLMVMSSDVVNRYGYVMPIEGLHTILLQSLRGIPTNYGHDSHRPAAWTEGLCVHIEPGLARVVGILTIPESAEEQAAIQKFAIASVKARLSDINSEDETNLRQLYRIIFPVENGPG